ncbi:glycoside hydrolase family 127 protein [Pedobacter rhodius]|uniref:Glycoside hydrolase family 127 protein n=1 Tax=Pedobacter rhodius TaxID=3004098 RepID=A0ABT4KTB0_9SPHI|nr:glycoside hydrolase family 127 protein [Pedobacter sp. SJ11]MCZ4222162.1 glycoside hydrolase family 127 protein [Pedobacter sp. SJ11]
MKTAIKIILLTILSIPVFGQQKLQAFKLNELILLDGPFKNAQQTDLKYILKLNPDRLLAPYLREAGLKPKAASYGNWENTGLDGHMAGHYLSALSLMYASTGNMTLKNRMDYMLSEIKRCQDANGSGYVSGIPEGKKMWAEIKNGDIRASSFSLNDKWVPLYNIHKIYAGLYDAYAVTGNLKAKKILIKLTDWCVDLVSGLSDKQVQEMLKSEQGGLNEVFANVYAITGDKKYLQLARKFSDNRILEPLLQNKDALNGLHANTQIPKVIGYEQVGIVDKDSSWSNAAAFFWNTVVNNRTVAIGGNSVREHFNPANDFSSMMESREGPETCNSYNMLKLTKQLFLSSPSAKYVDYYEETLYNHILTSQNPNGGFVYFTPIRPGHYRTYSNPQESFWCCVGSGLENHGKYGEMIYSHDTKALFVNLYIPSILNWKEKGIQLSQHTGFPNQETSKLTLKLKESSRFDINFRYPSWVEKGTMTVYVNGKMQVVKCNEYGYVILNRVWKSGDVIALKLPMHTKANFLPDGSDWVAFTRGPIVLAAELDTLSQPNLIADGSRMGHIAVGPLLPLNNAPLIAGNKASLADAIKPDNSASMTFSAAQIIYQPRYKNLKLTPFYNLSGKRYVIYWPYTSNEHLAERIKNISVYEAEKIKLETATVDLINTGEQQPETDHNFKGEQTDNGLFKERHYRNGKGWFSYRLKNNNLQGNKLSITLANEDKNKIFSIFINGKFIQKIELDDTKDTGFYNEQIEIPKELLTADMELKFVAEPGSSIANIYEIRLLK